MESVGVSKTTFEDLIEKAAVVSLHTPLTEETTNLIDTNSFGRFRSNAVLLNVARGELVDEETLSEALKRGEVGDTGLDVFQYEPADQSDELMFDSPLCSLDNVILTPRVAWYSKQADEERRRKAARDVKRVLQGGIAKARGQRPV
ncbi:hypothetical protein GCM10025751_48070 [Haladaptatus pallidirubidus]|uniref:D-isomer specific 2-hydroxyacid dehydrogenase NAD-binding domain-containing protein n=1 Tax=Haladaptatus pallidirubidus TaxID=1008152 RepID=A0AAV3UP55_9EURY